MISQTFWANFCICYKTYVRKNRLGALILRRSVGFYRLNPNFKQSLRVTQLRIQDEQRARLRHSLPFTAILNSRRFFSADIVYVKKNLYICKVIGPEGGIPPSEACRNDCLTNLNLNIEKWQYNSLTPPPRRQSSPASR